MPYAGRRKGGAAMEDRKTKHRLWIHTGGVFALVLAAALC
jgi:hypothetical protein